MRDKSRTMEELMVGDAQALASAMLQKAAGVAVMLEHAKVDNLPSFLSCIRENDIDLMSINSRNTSGTTALHVAAANGCMKVLAHLVTEVCVDINSADNWTRTALDEATKAGHEEAVRYLLAAGARHGTNIDWNRNRGEPIETPPRTSASPEPDDDGGGAEGRTTGDARKVKVRRRAPPARASLTDLARMDAPGAAVPSPGNSPERARVQHDRRGPRQLHRVVAEGEGGDDREGTPRRGVVGAARSRRPPRRPRLRLPTRRSSNLSSRRR